MYKVSVIIPNYNGKKYLKDCLDAMENQSFHDFEVLLIDNGSTDGSQEYVRTSYPWVKLISLKENTGFCGAVNQGIRNSRSPYVILLNNDTIAENKFIEELIKEIESKPKAFSCQAKLLEMKHPDKIDDGGNYYCALGWAFADGKGKKESSYNTEKQIFAACAGAAVYRRELLKKTGLFDEEHFAYLEDIDVCYRAKLYGYRSRYCPGAVVRHVGSGTSAGGSRYNGFKVKLAARNSLYLIYKNMPLAQILVNSPFLALGIALKYGFFRKLGFGSDYLAGLKEGFSTLGACRKVPFSFRRLPRYLAAEGEMIWGTCLYVFEFSVRQLGKVSKKLRVF